MIQVCDRDTTSLPNKNIKLTSVLSLCYLEDCLLTTTTPRKLISAAVANRLRTPNACARLLRHHPVSPPTTLLRGFPSQSIPYMAVVDNAPYQTAHRATGMLVSLFCRHLDRHLPLEPPASGPARARREQRRIAIDSPKTTNSSQDRPARHTIPTRSIRPTRRQLASTIHTLFWPTLYCAISHRSISLSAAYNHNGKSTISMVQRSGQSGYIHSLGIGPADGRYGCERGGHKLCQQSEHKRGSIWIKQYLARPYQMLGNGVE